MRLAPTIIMLLARALKMFSLRKKLSSSRALAVK